MNENVRSSRSTHKTCATLSTVSDQIPCLPCQPRTSPLPPRSLGSLLLSLNVIERGKLELTFGGEIDDGRNLILSSSTTTAPSSLDLRLEGEWSDSLRRLHYPSFMACTHIVIL